MPEGGVWAVVVARVANGAKSRLAPVLELEQRRELALAMLTDVLDVCGHASQVLTGFVAVVDDAAARNVAQAAGARVVDDPRPGDMNAAVRLGLAAAADLRAQTVIVLPGDVPLLSVDDLTALLAGAGEASRTVVIGASRDGLGTNALLLRPPDVIAPAFGPPSVDRHAQAALAAGALTQVVPNLGLALDVDTPADLAALEPLAAQRTAAWLTRTCLVAAAR
ncbi:MAG: 2-phospho-L-lactate guanylyltransferase [Chloroflexi bacterium]|nr:2-phospho-L-lactate guanylyltransferase [Chloroflexota bacterium]